MEILINGQTADITLDSEKNIGDILASLEQWLENSGHRLSGLSVDGKTANPSALDEIFTRQIDDVKVINIITSPLAELAAENILTLIADADEFEKLNFEQKAGFFDNWKDSAQAQFTSDQMPDLYSLFINTFSGGEVSLSVVCSIAEERLREIKEPLTELTNLKPLLEETCTKLVDLPLDIQTGKDARAAQTIQIFSGLAEKILRILRQLDIQGYLLQKISLPDDEKSFTQLINEFGEMVKEFLYAYEKQDSVLVGDLAEYEASVKLQELYNAITTNSRLPNSRLPAENAK